MMKLRPGEVIVPPVVGLECAKPELLIFHTNASIYEMADNLERLHVEGDVTELHRLEKVYGMKYSAFGLMIDRDLRVRGIYHPVDHQLRDPMHILTNAGVANTEIALCLHVAQANGIKRDLIATKIMEFKLPKKYGTVQHSWITENRLKDDTLSSFASTILALIPILLCFFQECVEAHGVMRDHIMCLSLLNDIINIIKLGADVAVLYVDRLSKLIDLHAQLFVSLYYVDAVKPKFHHLFHIVCAMRYLKKLLSCFVTERKHRASKRAALHVFRNLEHTVLADMVNQMCESFSEENGALFTKTSILGSLRFTIGGHVMHRGNSALLDCGVIHKGDIVCLDSSIVGRLLCFWRPDAANEFLAQIAVYNEVHEGGSPYYRESESSITFVCATLIVDACTWVYKRPGLLRVLLPFAPRGR